MKKCGRIRWLNVVEVKWMVEAGEKLKFEGTININRTTS